MVEAATLCGRSCNRICQVCPLVASGQWLPDMRARAGGGADALGGAVGGAARLVDVAEVEASGAEAVVIPTLTPALALTLALTLTLTLILTLTLTRRSSDRGGSPS